MEEGSAIEVFSALAHPGRFAVVRLLVRAGPQGVAAGEIARTLATPANTMSTQLAILARTGVIRSRRDSRSIIYSMDFDRMAGLIGFLMEDCCQGRAEIWVPLAAAASRAACCEPPEVSQGAAP